MKIDKQILDDVCSNLHKDNGFIPEWHGVRGGGMSAFFFNNLRNFEPINDNKSTFLLAPLYKYALTKQGIK